MDLGKVITALFGTLLVTFCLVTSILYLLPLYHKIQMDLLCRDYLYQTNASEGASQVLRNELTEALSDSGLSEIRISAPSTGQLKRRERQRFVVTGNLEITEASGFLRYRTKIVIYQFEGWVYGKRIIN